MKFPPGTYVKANPTSQLLQDCGFQNLAGRVEEYDGFLMEYTVVLDAESLNSFDDDEIRLMHREYEDPFTLDISEKNLLPGKRRDTEAQYAAAKERIDRLYQELLEQGLIDESEPDWDDPDDFLLQEAERNNKLILHDYERSAALADFTKEERSEYTSEAGLLLEVAQHYFGFAYPEEWTPDFIEEYALGHLPRKLLAKPKAFPAMGERLTVFLQWLYEEEHTDCGRLLVKEMRAATPQMAAAAADPRNHSFGKRFLGGDMAAGVDLTDEAALGDLMNRFNNLSFEERSRIVDGPSPAKVIPMDPFRHLGRNDRVNVRDTATGEVREKIKFKLVEKGLRSGALELLP
ncbi:MAG: hypothetical protein AAFZ52_12470 [Bacteroidota bacterium]